MFQCSFTDWSVCDLGWWQISALSQLLSSLDLWETNTERLSLETNASVAQSSARHSCSLIPLYSSTFDPCSAVCVCVCSLLRSYCCSSCSLEEANLLQRVSSSSNRAFSHNMWKLPKVKGLDSVQWRISLLKIVYILSSLSPSKTFYSILLPLRVCCWNRILAKDKMNQCGISEERTALFDRRVREISNGFLIEF